MHRATAFLPHTNAPRMCEVISPGCRFMLGQVAATPVADQLKRPPQQPSSGEPIPAPNDNSASSGLAYPCSSMRSMMSPGLRQRLLASIRFAPVLFVCAGCAVRDSETATRAKTALLGVSSLDLQSCLGAPDNRSTVGRDEVLTYKGNSTSSGGINITLPVIGGGISLSGGGYCNATFRVVEGRVAAVQYNGETDASLAPNAYCAPLVRNCVDMLKATDAPR